jgi:hypothetical protein
MNTKPKEELKGENNQSITRGISSKIHEEKIEKSSSIIPPENRDDDLLTLHKIHSILLNCINLNKKDKLEFCKSQRYFMKLYLQKMRDQLKEK